MRTPFASVGTGPSLRIAPVGVNSYSALFWVQYAPPTPAATNQLSERLISVLATTAPLRDRISIQVSAPAVVVATMNAADEGACGVLGLGAGGVALTTTGSTAGRGRERRGSDETSIGGFAVTSDTVVVRAVTAAATAH